MRAQGNRTVRPFLIPTFVFIFSLLACSAVLGQSDFIAHGQFGLEVGGGYATAKDIKGLYFGLSVSLGGIVDIGLAKGGLFVHESQW